MKPLIVLCLAAFLATCLLAQSSTPSMPNRINLSQAERDLVSARRTLENHEKLKSKETKSNGYNVNLDSDRQMVRSAENRVMEQQRNYDRAMDKYSRDMQSYLKAQDQKSQKK